MFIGRDEIVCRAVEALSSARVVTLLGPAGIGKSAIAREVSRRVNAPFVDPARARRRDGLVVLDGVDARLAEVKELRGPMLVTSREALRLEGEHVIEVPPLPEDDAAALFRARAEVDDSPLVRAIVKKLEGVPLAIELAARRAQILSLEDLLARLDDPARVVPALERALEISYALLGEDEKRGLAYASVFERPFTAEAFEAVAELEGDPLDVAEALLNKSLLVRVPGTGSVRLAMLHVLRAFARKAVTPETRARHARYVIDRASSLAARTYGPEAEAAMDELEADSREVLAAIEASAPSDAARGWLALFDVLLFRDVLDLRDPRFARMIEVADRAGDPRLAARARVLHARAILEVGTPALAEKEARAAVDVSPEIAPEALRTVGWALIAQGKPGEALPELEEALTKHASEGDVRGQADALAAIGMASALLGDIDQAKEKLVLSRAIHVTQGDTTRLRKVEDMLRVLGAAEGSAIETSAEILRASADKHAARGQRWREALDMALLAQVLGDGKDGDDARLRARAAATAAAVAIPSLTPERPWTVGPEARWFEPPGGARQDLARHGSLRRVFDALVTARLASPGRALSADDVLAAGWPDEKVLYEAGMLRVYTAIRRIRGMGFDAVLLTRDDGYLLDPRTRFVRG